MAGTHIIPGLGVRLERLGRCVRIVIKSNDYAVNACIE